MPCATIAVIGSGSFWPIWRSRSNAKTSDRTCARRLSGFNGDQRFEAPALSFAQGQPVAGLAELDRARHDTGVERGIGIAQLLERPGPRDLPCNARQQHLEMIRLAHDIVGAGL